MIYMLIEFSITNFLSFKEKNTFRNGTFSRCLWSSKNHKIINIQVTVLYWSQSVYYYSLHTPTPPDSPGIHRLYWSFLQTILLTTLTYP